MTMKTIQIYVVQYCSPTLIVLNLYCFEYFIAYGHNDYRW